MFPVEQMSSEWPRQQLSLKFNPSPTRPMSAERPIKQLLLDAREYWDHEGTPARSHFSTRALRMNPPRLQSAILGCYLKNRTNAVSTSIMGCAVQIPRFVKGNAAVGKGPIRVPAKDVENSLRPR